MVSLRAAEGVRYTVPASLDIGRMEEAQTVRFRVGDVYRDAAIEVSCDGRILRSVKKKVLAPGEMEQIILKKQELEAADNPKEIVISVRTQGQGKEA